MFGQLLLIMSTSPSGRKSPADEIAPTTADGNVDDAQQFQQIIRDRKCKFLIDELVFDIFLPTCLICNQTLLPD